MEDFRLNGMFRAVVEDNKDPLKQGRVRLRILGVHSPLVTEMKTEKLPWAEQAYSLFNAGESGFGVSSIPLQGTWVWVFFERGEHTRPVYFASIKGQTDEKPNETYMFRDPDEEHPKSQRLGEPDINRFARNEELNQTLEKEILDNRDIVTGSTDSVSSANVDMQEPKPTANKVEYTKNNVIETTSGHILEIDDTPENERIRIIHKSGSYMEMKPDGSFVTRSQSGKENYIILEGNLNKHIKQGVKTYIEKNLDEIIAGEVKRQIKLNLSEHINGDLNLTVDGNVNWAVGGSVNWNVGSTIGVVSGSTMTVNNGGTYTHNAPIINLN